MLRQSVVRASRHVSMSKSMPCTSVRHFATTTTKTTTTTTSTKATRAQRLTVFASAITVGAAAAAVGIVEAKEEPVNVDQVKTEIATLIEKDNMIGPTFLRLAWHASGTFCKHDKTGGSQGGTIRFSPEIKYGANAGLDSAIQALEGIKTRNPRLSYADLFVLSGIVAIEQMDGPSVPFRLGRKDAENGSACTDDGRLPDADKGSSTKTTQHVRDIFYRMGFNDREIVALVGAHAVGRCYPSRSGYSGPWTRAEWTFSNEYFRELIENKWTKKHWDGPEQYEDPSGDLMMLPADMALVWDKEFRKYVELYAKDEELWHKDFANAFQKLTENGVKFPSGWRRYIFFGPRD